MIMERHTACIDFPMLGPREVLADLDRGALPR